MTRAWMAVVVFAGLTASASAQTSWGVAATATNDVVFCDVRRDRVWRLDAHGALSVVMPNTHCRAVVLGGDGFVYGESVSIGRTVDASTGASRDNTMGIWRVAPGGVARWIEPPTAHPDPSIWVVIDKDGRSYSWNGALPLSTLSQVMRRDQVGLVTSVAGMQWGRRDGLGADARFGRVAGLALAPDGTLLVADSGNLRRVTDFGQVRTESVGTISDPEVGVVGQLGLWDHPLGIAAAPDSSALVVDYPAGRIVRIAPDGVTREIWRSHGWANWISGGRWGWRPTGVAVLSSGFYVLEDWSMPALAADLIGVPRVVRVRPDGSSSTLVSVSSLFVRAAVLVAVIMLASGFRRRQRKG